MSASDFFEISSVDESAIKHIFMVEPDEFGQLIQLNSPDNA